MAGEPLGSPTLSALLAAQLFDPERATRAGRTAGARSLRRRPRGRRRLAGHRARLRRLRPADDRRPRAAARPARGRRHGDHGAGRGHRPLGCAQQPGDADGRDGRAGGGGADRGGLHRDLPLRLDQLALEHDQPDPRPRLPRRPRCCARGAGAGRNGRDRASRARPAARIAGDAAAGRRRCRGGAGRRPRGDPDRLRGLRRDTARGSTKGFASPPKRPPRRGAIRGGS